MARADQIDIKDLPPKAQAQAYRQFAEDADRHAGGGTPEVEPVKEHKWYTRGLRAYFYIAFFAARFLGQSMQWMGYHLQVLSDTGFAWMKKW